MKRRNIPVLTLFIIFIATAAFAQGPGPGGPGGPPPGQGQGQDGPNILFEFLDLTDAQIEAWQGLVDAHREAIRPLREEQRALHEQLRDAIESDTPDALTIGNLMIATHDLKEEQKAAREALEVSLTALLTADQIIRYEAFKAAQALLGRGGGHRGTGGSGGPGGPGGGKKCRNC